ncbi:MAG: CRISPR-associated endonuclease Cas2 [Armatimonadota bacterium]|nr:CRISPR-associated endonuclease Cas2 [Armatimonadota bacterium]
MSSAARGRYLIVYDITDDAKRTKLSKLLQDYGDRVQKSVFEADLNAAEVAEILRLASPFVASSDSLRLYPTCAACRKGVCSLGITIVKSDQSLCII